MAGWAVHVATSLLKASVLLLRCWAGAPARRRGQSTEATSCWSRCQQGVLVQLQCRNFALRRTCCSVNVGDRSCTPLLLIGRPPLLVSRVMPAALAACMRASKSLNSPPSAARTAASLPAVAGPSSSLTAADGPRAARYCSALPMRADASWVLTLAVLAFIGAGMLRLSITAHTNDASDPEFYASPSQAHACRASCSCAENQTR